MSRRFDQALQDRPLRSQLPQGAVHDRALDGDLNGATDIRAERCTPLALDRLDWSARDHRIAAAVLGEAVRYLLAVVTHCGHHDDIGETVRVAVDLSREAAFYARHALDLEAVEAGTVAGVTR